MVGKIVAGVRKNVAHLFASAGYSLAGLWACVRDEAAFRHELLAGIVHFGLILWLDLSFAVCIYLTVLYVLLLAIELLNTSIEAVVDLATEGRIHSLAKKAKDCASAAVFCIVVLFVGSWLYVLIR